MNIKKAVFPVAGFGTRFLPATKATPKEMLPIVDKPLIQYAVEKLLFYQSTNIQVCQYRLVQKVCHNQEEIQHKQGLK